MHFVWLVENKQHGILFLSNTCEGGAIPYFLITILFIVGGFFAFLINPNNAIASKIENMVITLVRPIDARPSTIPVNELDLPPSM